MRIGDLAARTGVSVRSLRYYEEQGLLASTRSASGQRHYAEDDVDRVKFLQRLYAAGLSSRTILELLPCVDSPSEKHADLALERMAQERDRLSQHIADLVRTRESLDGLMATARAHRERLDDRGRPVTPPSGVPGSDACRTPTG
ncbi:MerR family transcriptional regulator [Actinoallomurus sp. NPDC052274]|uniref:MerR family transcriptional regulator n=1 Tax=Actinoallomurus sp. NPDC052274 TaxID=3155420 RepID=UPI00341AA6D1